MIRRVVIVRRFCRLFLIIMLIVAVLYPVVSSVAADGNRDFKPLDLVIVFDVSGSMEDSDRPKLTKDAITNLICAAPVKDSRIGLVAFNSQPHQYATPNGTKLLSMENLNSVSLLEEYIKKRTDDYSGDTDIGKALISATKMFKDVNTKKEQPQKLILLITDGEDDGDISYGKTGYNAKTNYLSVDEKKAIDWANENDCPIFCVGYNYVTEEKGKKKQSMSADGKGDKVLTAISEKTNGELIKFTNVLTPGSTYNDIKRIDELFERMLEKFCGLIVEPFTPVSPDSGNGKKHTNDIPIKSDTIEATLKLTCKSPNALKNGEIRVIETENGDGKKRYYDEKSHSNDVRISINGRSATIKIITPADSTWEIELDKIFDEDIRFSYFAQVAIGMKTTVTTKSGDNLNELAVDDVLNFSAVLTREGSDMKSEYKSIYDSVKKHTAIIYKKSSQEQASEVDMEMIQEKDNLAFTGSYTVSSVGEYEIKIVLDAIKFYREEIVSFTVAPPNLSLVSGKKPSDRNIDIGEEIVIENISSYINNKGNLKLDFSAKSNQEDVVFTEKYNSDADTISLKGISKGTATVTITCTDTEYNRSKEIPSFTVQVSDPVGRLIKISVISGIVALLLVAAFLITLFIRRKKREIPFRFRLDSWEGHFSNDYKSVDFNYKTLDNADFLIMDKINEDDPTCSMLTMDTLVQHLFKYYSETHGQTSGKETEFLNNYFGQISDMLAEVKIIGTFKGQKGFAIKVPPNSKVTVDNGKEKKCNDDDSFTIAISGDEGAGQMIFESQISCKLS